MKLIQQRLTKRRNIALIVLLCIALLSVAVSYYWPFSPPQYIQSQYRMPLVYFLVVYKIIELGIFYLIFYRKHLLRVVITQRKTLDTFEKQAKKFFFLVPQGSIVFGVLSYKLSSNILYLWFFLLLASSVLFWVNPKYLSQEK